MDALTHSIIQYGCLAIFSLLMLGIVGLPIPDETLVVGAYLFRQKRIRQAR